MPKIIRSILFEATYLTDGPTFNDADGDKFTPQTFREDFSMGDALLGDKTYH